MVNQSRNQIDLGRVPGLEADVALLKRELGSFQRGALRSDVRFDTIERLIVVIRTELESYPTDDTRTALEAVTDIEDEFTARGGPGRGGRR